MKKRDTQLKRYYRSIQSSLPCSASDKARYIRDLKETVATFLGEHPDADFEAVERHFGTPQQITDTYLEEIGSSEIVKKLCVRKWTMRIVLVVITVALLAWLITLGGALIDFVQSDYAYIETYITEG